MIEPNPKATGIPITLGVWTEPPCELIDGLWYGPPGLIIPEEEGRAIILGCPGCGRLSSMRVGFPKPVVSPSWQVRGDFKDLKTITLSPSINCKHCCGWHGYLVNGVLNVC